MVTGHDVESAAALSVHHLRSVRDRSWVVAVPDLEMTVSDVVAHMAQCCIWYAVDLSAGGDDLDVIQPLVRADGSPDALIDSLDALARLLRAAIDAATPSQRGFHPYGQADASGFAAMACDELLVHTYDIGLALGFDLRPDRDLADRVLRRLFPWAPDHVDPWIGLLWANGRVPLGEHPRLERWRWHCAPLDEWDGAMPSPPVRR